MDAVKEFFTSATATASADPVKTQGADFTEITGTGDLNALEQHSDVLTPLAGEPEAGSPEQAKEKGVNLSNSAGGDPDPVLNEPDLPADSEIANQQLPSGNEGDMTGLDKAGNTPFQTVAKGRLDELPTLTEGQAGSAPEAAPKTAMRETVKGKDDDKAMGRAEEVKY